MSIQSTKTVNALFNYYSVIPYLKCYC